MYKFRIASLVQLVLCVYFAPIITNHQNCCSAVESGASSLLSRYNSSRFYPAYVPPSAIDRKLFKHKKKKFFKKKKKDPYTKKTLKLLKTLPKIYEAISYLPHVGYPQQSQHQGGKKKKKKRHHGSGNCIPVQYLQNLYKHDDSYEDEYDYDDDDDDDDDGYGYGHGHGRHGVGMSFPVFHQHRRSLLARRRKYPQFSNLLRNIFKSSSSPVRPTHVGRLQLTTAHPPFYTRIHPSPHYYSSRYKGTSNGYRTIPVTEANEDYVTNDHPLVNPMTLGIAKQTLHMPQRITLVRQVPVNMNAENYAISYGNAYIRNGSLQNEVPKIIVTPMTNQDYSTDGWKVMYPTTTGNDDLLKNNTMLYKVQEEKEDDGETAEINKGGRFFRYNLPVQ